MKTLKLLILLYYLLNINGCSSSTGDIVNSPVTKLYALMGVLEWSENEESVYFGKYEGEIKNDKPAGKGKIEYPDGSMYEGRWSGGKRNGRGTSISFDGGL